MSRSLQALSRESPIGEYRLVGTPVWTSPDGKLVPVVNIDVYVPGLSLGDIYSKS